MNERKFIVICRGHGVKFDLQGWSLRTLYSLVDCREATEFNSATAAANAARHCRLRPADFQIKPKV